MSMHLGLSQASQSSWQVLKLSISFGTKYYARSQTAVS